MSGKNVGFYGSLDNEQNCLCMCFFNILLLHSGLVCKLVVEEVKSREDIKSLLFCTYGAFHLEVHQRQEVLSYKFYKWGN